MMSLHLRVHKRVRARAFVRVREPRVHDLRPFLEVIFKNSHVTF